MRIHKILAVVALAVACVVSAPVHADAVADFYKGKDVTIVIGAGVGGSYGLYAQLAAKHLKKHIPGNPNLVVQSMPGAGGLKGLNYTYGVAPRDGSVLTVAHAEVLFETLLGQDNKFNARDYRWLGRLMDADFVGLTSKRSGAKNLDDAKKREVIVGATGANSVTAVGPVMFNRFIGTKFKIVAGYKGTSDIFKAMEQGEADSVAVSWVTATVLHGEKIKSGDLIPIYAIAGGRLAALPNVPNVTEFGRTAEEKAFVEIYSSSALIGRALATPPNVPDDRVKALRAAFDRMVKDPEFVADAEQKKIPINVMSGDKLAAQIERIMATPKPAVDGARKVYKELLDAVAR